MFIPLQGCALALRLNRALVLDMDSKRPLATPEGEGSGRSVASHIWRVPGPGTAEASWGSEVREDPPRLAAGEASLKNQDKPLQEAPDAFKFGLGFARPRWAQFLKFCSKLPFGLIFTLQQRSRRKWISLGSLFRKLLLKLFPNQLHLSFQAPGRPCPRSGQGSNCKTRFSSVVTTPSSQQPWWNQWNPRNQKLLPLLLSIHFPLVSRGSQDPAPGTPHRYSAQRALCCAWDSSQPSAKVGPGFPGTLLLQML